MSIFAGTKEINAIKVGGTDVKAVYAGDEKVWPELIEIPTAPNHTWAGRVIYSFGTPQTDGNNRYTEFGGPIPGCNVTAGDFHLLVAAHRGGADQYAQTLDFGYTGGMHSIKERVTNFAESHKLNVGLCIAPADGTSLDHYITDRSTNTLYPYDFLAYAWTFPKELFGSPDEVDLAFRQMPLAKPIQITDGQPNGIALEACCAIGTSTSTDYKGLNHKQKGTGVGKNYTLVGGYKYIRLDSNGEYFEGDGDAFDNLVGTGTAARVCVYLKR